MNFLKNLSEPSHIARLIDHTLLKPEATASDIRQLCSEAREHSFASVCVNPFWVRLAAERLADSGVNVCTVIGFPLGANEPDTKSFETTLAISQGAREVDVVQNVGALRSGEHEFVRQELTQLAKLAHEGGALLKVILETALLNEEEKRTACALAVDAGVNFVKTSTGFSAGGATAEDVALMRSAVGEAIGVKASGGIRTLANLHRMVQAGASRIGTSAGIQILRELAEGAQAAEFSENTGRLGRY